MPQFVITSPDGTKYRVTAPEGATEEEALAQVQSQAGTQPPSVLADVAKSGGAGIGRGTLGLLGLPGDIASLINRGIDYGAEKLGVAGPKANYDLGTSGQLQRGVEKVTGPFYKPQTKAGEVAQTAGEFLPAMIGGPESLALKLGTRIAAPVAAVEATKAVTDNPYAQAGAAIAATALAHRQAIRPNPAAAELKSMGPVEALKNPVVDQVVFNPVAVDALSNVMQNMLRQQKFNPRDARQTFGLLEDLKTPLNGQAQKIEDLQKTRERLSDLAKRFGSDDSAAATQAIKMLDGYLSAAPQSHAIAGNLPEAVQIMSESRANFAHGATAEKVAEKVRNAELQAASTYGGGNLDNATRQKLRPLLTSRKGRMGFAEEDLGNIENAVTGSNVGNALRQTGKWIGRYGPALMGLGGYGGSLVGGPLGLAGGAIIPPILEASAKGLGNAITSARANRIAEAILARSPEAIKRRSNAPSNTSLSRAAIAEALASRGLMLPESQSPYQ